jgi:glycolate oxidase iron-sulfur subunit
VLSARSLATPVDAPRGGNPSAWCFTGCVMDAWQRDTHRSTVRVMRAMGADVARPGSGGACCGALHVHAGRTSEAERLARRVIASMPGAAPIVVNSAGCGAVMKDYGRLLGTAEAAAFSGRVRDFSEWVVEEGVPRVRSTATTVVVQDPCHLRHVQRAHAAVRTVLAPAYSLVETDDDGLCCGAGGAYAVLQPELANEIRERKADALRRAATGAIVASANPGCMLHLRQAGLDVRHPADLLADVLIEQEQSSGG